MAYTIISNFFFIYLDILYILVYTDISIVAPFANGIVDMRDELRKTQRVDSAGCASLSGLQLFSSRKPRACRAAFSLCPLSAVLFQPPLGQHLPQRALAVWAKCRTSRQVSAEIIFYILFKMPAFQNRLVGDIESFSKGLKKAG
eukprot:SAG22_NODE_9266_length_599_cov_2.018000_1_plen_143_part_10